MSMGQQAWKVQVAGFDGPLDLLLHLIDRQQLDIYDIPIASVTAQYLRFLEDMPVIDLDRASSFLVMAATLLQIKARLLMPPVVQSDCDEELELDPRRELVAALVEYRRFRLAGSALADLAAEFNCTVRGPDREPEDVNAGHTPTAPEPGAGYGPFIAAVSRVSRLLLARTRPIVTRDRFGVVRKIRSLLRQLRHAGDSLSFREAVGRWTLSDVVSTFLALLELVRRGRVRATQARMDSEIVITPITRRRRIDEDNRST